MAISRQNPKRRKISDCSFYARYSSERQNDRSIEQQRDTVERELKRQGLDYRIVGSYEDRGKSAKFQKTRPGFQGMLADIKSGRLQVDAILVDDIKRFSRSDECAAIQTDLKRYAVVVLAADRQFELPDTGVGKIVAAVDSLMAEQDNESRAHCVYRGMLDSVKQGHVPNGPAPFGTRIEWVTKAEIGVEIRDHSILVPHEEEASVVVELYRLADECGFASQRVYNAIKDDDRFSLVTRQRLNPNRIDYILKNPIYIGRYEWGTTESYVEGQQQVRVAKPQEEWVVNENFIDPIIDSEVYDRVQKSFAARSRKRRVGNKSENGVEHRPPGISLKNPLAGLCRCKDCGRSMVPTRCGGYETKSGEIKNYEKLQCPANKDGGRCENNTRVPLPWLIDTVFDLIRDRLFLRDLVVSDDMEGMVAAIQSHPEFSTFVESVLQELATLEAFRPDRSETLERELSERKSDRDGLLLSVRNPGIIGDSRRVLEQELKTCLASIEEFELELQSITSDTSKLSDAVDAAAIAAKLAQLGKVLHGKNATLLNTLLAQHIVRIDCRKDRSVGIVLTRLGALSVEACEYEWIREQLSESPSADNTVLNALPDTSRPLTRRHILYSVGDTELADSLNNFAVDPNRFMGIGSDWIETVTVEIPVKKSWVQENARTVAEFRLEHGYSMDRTASHFEKTVPTIRAAMKIAKEEYGIDAFGKQVSRRTRPNWSRTNAKKVWEYLQQPGATQKQAAEHFNRSIPTIVKAFRFYEAERERGDDDGNQGPDQVPDQVPDQAT